MPMVDQPQAPVVVVVVTLPSTTVLVLLTLGTLHVTVAPQTMEKLELLVSYTWKIMVIERYMSIALYVINTCSFPLM